MIEEASPESIFVVLPILNLVDKIVRFQPASVDPLSELSTWRSTVYVLVWSLPLRVREMLGVDEVVTENPPSAELLHARAIAVATSRPRRTYPPLTAIGPRSGRRLMVVSPAHSSRKGYGPLTTATVSVLE